MGKTSAACVSGRRRKSMRCAECGREIEAAKNRKYCPDCARAVQRRKKAEARQRDREARERVLAAADRESTARMLSLTGKSLPRVAAEAAALGLNYGAYTALVSGGELERWCRERGIDWRERFRGIRADRAGKGKKQRGRTAGSQ